MPRVLKIQVSATEQTELVNFIFTPLDNNFSFDETTLKIIRDIHLTNLSLYQYLSQVKRSQLYVSYVAELTAAAIACFDSDLIDFSYGLFLLDQCRSNFVITCGHLVREKFLARLSVLVLAIGIPVTIAGFCSTILYGVSNAVLERAGGHFPDDVARWTSGYAAVIVGACVGTWISSVLRNRYLTWDSLRIFDPDGFSPLLRLCLILGLTLVLCMLVSLKIVNLGVADANLSDYLTDHRIALLLGIVGGMSEDAVTKLVVARVARISQEDLPRRDPK